MEQKYYKVKDNKIYIVTISRMSKKQAFKHHILPGRCQESDLGIRGFQILYEDGTVEWADDLTFEAGFYKYPIDPPSQEILILLYNLRQIWMKFKHEDRLRAYKDHRDKYFCTYLKMAVTHIESAINDIDYIYNCLQHEVDSPYALCNRTFEEAVHFLNHGYCVARANWTHPFFFRERNQFLIKADKFKVTLADLQDKDTFRPNEDSDFYTIPYSLGEKRMDYHNLCILCCHADPGREAYLVPYSVTVEDAIARDWIIF